MKTSGAPVVQCKFPPRVSHALAPEQLSRKGREDRKVKTRSSTSREFPKRVPNSPRPALDKFPVLRSASPLMNNRLLSLAILLMCISKLSAQISVVPSETETGMASAVVVDNVSLVQ